MGIPLVATPILALLFDLQTAIAIAVLATFINDLIFLVRMDKNWALIKHAAILLAFGVAGTALGSYLLVRLNPSLLSGLLGVIILIYVATSFFSQVPTIKRRVWLDSVVGIIGGTFQGTTGSSGPVIGMYLLQMKLSRNDYLFILNSFFLAVDCMQLTALYKLGLYRGEIALYALAALIPTLVGLAVAFKVHQHISDAWFRKAVFIVMTFSAVTLLYKSIASFL